jgi:hypothetical protein
MHASLWHMDGRARLPKPGSALEVSISVLWKE